MIGPVPVCVKCVHLIDPETTSVYMCRAFPKGIPDEIIFGKVEHKTKYKGDHGFQFKSYSQFEKEQRKEKK